ncbi:MAG: hypothetical protein H7145_14585 [Akkermansiaceae bacterium]|nr:hypothetical protein [Armatimonadota bacterium]
MFIRDAALMIAAAVFATPAKAQTFFFSTDQTIANDKPLDKKYPDLRVGVDEAGKDHVTSEMPHL